jgi:hypothetical protein
MLDPGRERRRWDVGSERGAKLKLGTVMLIPPVAGPGKSYTMQSRINFEDPPVCAPSQ